MSTSRTSSPPDLQRFGAMVLAARQLKGLSQTALARVSGVTQSTISALETSNIDDLAFSRVARLIQALDLDPRTVFPAGEKLRRAA